VKRLIDLWNAYWFPTTSTLNLAGARIVAVAVQLFLLFPRLDYHINLALKNTEFIAPQPLIRAIAAVVPRETLFNAGGLTAVYWISIAAGAAALVGLFTRTSLFLFALGSWFFVSHAYSYDDVHHTQALFAIFLMALPFSPAGASLSVDALIRRRRARAGGDAPGAAERADTAMWPLKLAHVLLAMTYFSTGITKLISGGLAWMNGYTLQNHIFSDAVNRGIPLGIWLAQQHTLCILLAVATILFELFFFVSILLPRTAPYWFAGGLMFHLGLLVTSGHPFYEHMLLNLLLLLFLDPDWFPARLRKLEALVSGRQPQAEAREAS
jgi:hypothetical protein